MSIRSFGVLICASLMGVIGASGTEVRSTDAPATAPRIDLRLILAQASPLGNPPRATTCPAESKTVLRPTPECGFSAKGEPRAGVFQCSLRLESSSTGCEEYCRLVECRSP